MTSLHFLPTALLPLLLSAGCAQHVYSPPSRGFAMESARPIGAKRTGVSAEGAFYGEVFGPDVSSIGTRVRRGLRDDLDITGDLTAARVNETSAMGTNRGFYAGRVGAKLAPGANTGFAFTGGAGAGFAPAGGAFTSADLGFIASIDNCYVIPSVSVSGFVSEPLDPRPIDVTEPGDEFPVRDTPETTWGYSWKVGIKVPLSHARCPLEPPVALTTGIGVTGLSDSDSSDEFISAGLGIEVNL